MLNKNDLKDKLNLPLELNKKLKENNINTINDIWILKRKELKEKQFNDSEIKQIIIALQLQGLDLNKRVYN